MPQAVLLHEEGQNYTPTIATPAGNVIKMADGRAGIVAVDLAANQKGAIVTEGVFFVTSATGTLFAAGEDVYFDAATGLAVKAPPTATSSKIGTAAIPKVSGDLVVRTDLNAVPPTLKIATQIGYGTSLTNSAVETVIGTAVIPANTLKAGQVLSWFLQAMVLGQNGTDTHRFRVRVGGLTGAVLVDSTAINAAIYSVFLSRGEIVITAAGASGVFAGAAVSTFGANTFTSVLGAAIDTTVAQTLVLTALQGSASAGNSARTDIFNLEQK